MPQYRIVSELDPGPDHRDARGTRLRLDEARVITVTAAQGISELLEDIERGLPAAGEASAHQGRRIISVEEIHPGVAAIDEQITKALTSPQDDWTTTPMIDPEEFVDGQPIFGGGDFIWTVSTVADALRESGLVPGLHLSLLDSGDGFVDYSMVEIHDDARMIYLSRGVELKHLTDDRSATGWDGILAIARALIALSNDLH